MLTEAARDNEKEKPRRRIGVRGRERRRKEKKKEERKKTKTRQEVLGMQKEQRSGKGWRGGTQKFRAKCCLEVTSALKTVAAWWLKVP
jgi:hypothetical protein